MTLNEMIEKRNALRTEATELTERAVSVEEMNSVDAKQDEINLLNRKIEVLQTNSRSIVCNTVEAGENLATQKPWGSFGEFLQGVRNAGSGTVDSRLETRATGASAGVPADGGYLVNTDFASEILKRTYENSQVASLCKKIQVSADSNALETARVNETSRVDGSRPVQAYWAAEAATVTSSKVPLGKDRLELQKLMGLYYATDELLKDASALGQLVTDAFVDEFKFKLQDAIIRGDGSGKPQGILNAPALVTVSKEGSQTADTVVSSNIMKMWSRMYGPSRANAVWLINQDLEPQLFQMFIASTSVPVYMPANGISGQPFGTLFGRPVIPIEHCSTLGDLGDIFLADFDQYLLIEKGGIETAESIHVKFIYDETAFRFTYRVNGQSRWASALTPFKGSNTLSPFVTLEARA